VSALKVVSAVVLLVGCKQRVSAAECEAMVGRYAELVVVAQLPDASPEVVAKESAREKSEARGTDVFKNCSAEITRKDWECAMHAVTADALEKCLE
jgi:hypothetical protein